jgi:hypothetical protein
MLYHPFAKQALFSFFGVFIASAIAHKLLKKCLPKSTLHFFTMHVFFNAWVTYMCVEEAVTLFWNPLDNLRTYVKDSSMATAGIGAFHFYHMVGFSKLTTEDLIHHIVSCGLVVALGLSFPYGNVGGLCDIVMCGVPGGIDYIMLILVKLGWLHKTTEKYWNRWLNLLCRFPGMALAFYLILISLDWSNNFWHSLGNFAAPTLHVINAIYYCDKVVGNYHVVTTSTLQDKNQ